MLQRYLSYLYDRGVTMLRIDAAAHLIPDHLWQVINHLPWDFVVQEYYPDAGKWRRGQWTGALRIGHLTGMDYGISMTPSLFDTYQDGKWVSSMERFKDL